MWVVQGFPTGSEDLVKDLIVSADYPDDLARSVFEIGPDEPPIGSLRITPAVAAVLQPYVSEPFDLEQFEYFLEFDADESDEHTAVA